MTRPPERMHRSDYRYFMTVPTRWNDNDMLGHVNNVVYYSYFEAVVVQFVMREMGLDWLKWQNIPYAVETRCRFWRPIAYPAIVEAGLVIERLGGSSVTNAARSSPRRRAATRDAQSSRGASPTRSYRSCRSSPHHPFQPVATAAAKRQREYICAAQASASSG